MIEVEVYQLPQIQHLVSFHQADNHILLHAIHIDHPLIVSAALAPEIAM
jgi:hypothetical protein